MSKQKKKKKESANFKIRQQKLSSREQKSKSLKKSREKKSKHPKGTRDLSGSSDGKESACNAGHLGLISGLGRFPGEGNGNPLQYPCLERPMDRGAWKATVHGIAKSQTLLSD